MPKGQRDKSESIDQLASGKLPKHVLDAINNLTLTVDEVVQWDSSKPVVDVGLSDRKMRIRINLSVPLGKFIASTTATVGVLWTLVVFATKYEPIITSIISRLRP